MRKCPKCNSLVDDSRTECCGLPLPPAGATPTATTASQAAPVAPEVASSATVALSPAELQRLSASVKRDAIHRGPTPAPRPTPGAPARPEYPGSAAAKNQDAKRAFVLGILSILPIFPIALAALVYGILGLSSAARIPGAPGRSQALVGIISGTVFGVLWTAVTISYLIPG